MAGQGRAQDHNNKDKECRKHYRPTNSYCYKSLPQFTLITAECVNVPPSQSSKAKDYGLMLLEALSELPGCCRVSVWVRKALTALRDYTPKNTETVTAANT